MLQDLSLIPAPLLVHHVALLWRIVLWHSSCSWESWPSRVQLVSWTACKCDQLDTAWRCCGWIIMHILSTILAGRTYICVHAGILAYIGFGGYVNLGQTLWSEELNYYLIPILVSWKRFFILELSLSAWSSASYSCMPVWWLPVSHCSWCIHTQVLIVAAYLISSGFMSVYHMAVDTIFICASEFNLDAPCTTSRKLDINEWCYLTLNLGSWVSTT